MIKELLTLEKKDLIGKGLKLCEECGEVASELLKYKGLKGTSDSKNTIRNKILLECADCMYILQLIVSELNFTDEQLNKKIQLKKIKRKVQLKKEKKCKKL